MLFVRSRESVWSHTDEFAELSLSLTPSTPTTCPVSLSRSVSCSSFPCSLRFAHALLRTRSAHAPFHTSAPVRDMGGALALLLHPGSAEEFLASEFRRNTRHVQRSASAGGSDHFSANLADRSEIGELLTAISDERHVSEWAQYKPHGPSPTFPAGAPPGVFESAGLPEEETGHIDTEAALAGVNDGKHSLVVPLEGALAARPGLAPKLGEWVRHLGDAFGVSPGVNLYLSAPGSTVLAPHTDRYDVFVIQLWGSKAWKTCVPVPDTEDARGLDEAQLAELYEVRRATPDGCHEYVEQDLAAMDCTERTMGPGDVLYMPKGVVHMATTGDVASAHLTVSLPVQGRTWGDLFAAVAASEHGRDTAVVAIDHDSGSDVADTGCMVFEAATAAVEMAAHDARGLGWRQMVPMWLLRSACPEGAVVVHDAVDNGGRPPSSCQFPRQIVTRIQERLGELVRSSGSMTTLIVETLSSKAVSETCGRSTTGTAMPSSWVDHLGTARRMIERATRDSNALQEGLDALLQGGRGDQRVVAGKGSESEQEDDSRGELWHFDEDATTEPRRLLLSKRSQQRRRLTTGYYDTGVTRYQSCGTNTGSTSNAVSTVCSSCQYKRAVSGSKTQSCDCQYQMQQTYYYMKTNCDGWGCGWRGCGSNSCDAKQFTNGGTQYVWRGDTGCDATGYTCSCTTCSDGQYGPTTSGCASCPKGYKCTGGGRAKCDKGTFQDEGGKTDCKSCSMGQYQDVIGKSSCNSCGSGTWYSTGSANTVCEKCLAGKYTSASGCADLPGWMSSTKANCQQYKELKWCTPDGKYGTGWSTTYGTFAKWAVGGKDASQACCACGGGDPVGNTACSACPSGNTCDGSRTIISCGAGKYANLASTSCASCTSNKYSSGAANSACATCASGSYTTGSTAGNTACTACPAGYRCDGSTTKTGCGAGTYSTAGLASCKSCGSGTQYSTGSANTVCEKCLAGKYTSGGSAGNTACSACPSGKSCDGSRTLISCGAGKYANVAGTSCASCTGDQYSTGASNSGCSTCSAGRFTGDTAANTACNACPSGYACNGSTKTGCVAGKYSKSDGTYCAWCGTSNKYSSGASNSVCAKCATGSFTSGSSSSVMLTNTHCSACIAGYSCGGTRYKMPCAAGKYSSSDGTSCVSCGTSNKYSSGAANSACASCASGSYTTGNTAGNTACNACPAGFGCDGSRNKNACGAGVFSLGGLCQTCGTAKLWSGGGSGVANTQCETCADGSYTSGSASANTACDTCPSGHSCDGSRVKTSCGAGMYASSSGCISCGIGNKYSSGASNAACSTCDAGSYASGDSTKNTACTTCSAGFSCDGTRSQTKCGPGENSGGTGAASCKLCASAGAAYSTGATNSACATCDPGSYTSGDSTSNTACTTCPAGSTCGGTRTRNSCNAGKYSTSGSSSCTSCGSDTKYSGLGASVCIDCRSGSYTDGGGSTTRTVCKTCPAGSACDGSSRAQPCTAGTYAGPGSNVCTKCDAHQYSGAGHTKCTICSKGSFTRGDKNGNTACIVCPAGYSCAGDGNFKPCAKDNMWAQSGASACAACTADKYTQGTGGPTKRESCDPCPSGQSCDGTSNTNTCAAGKYSNAGKCSACGKPNLYSAAGASGCKGCVAGSYTDCLSGFSCTKETRQVCTICPAGSTCDENGASACVAGTAALAGTGSCAECGSDSKFSTAGVATCSTCPTGSYTLGGTTNTHTACARCEAGYWCDGTSKRRPCPTGKFSGSVGAGDASTCKDCGSNKLYADIVGQDSCKTCPRQKFTSGGDSSGNNRDKCSPCQAGYECVGITGKPDRCAKGTYSAIGAAACTACSEDNMYAGPDYGFAGGCEECPPGSFTTGSSSSLRTQCTPCPKGSACPGGSTKTLCPKGTASSDKALKCNNCGADTLYSDKEGMAVCSTCSSGSFTSGGSSSGETRSACEVCPAGHRCDGSSGTVGTDACPSPGPCRCDAGKYSGGSLSACKNCAADNKYSSVGAASCSSCNPGSFTNGGGTVTRTMCSSCPPGFACKGGSDQQPCSPGTASPGGADVCSNCGDDKKYSAAKNGECTACSSGSYTGGGRDKNTHTFCKLCSAGYACDGSSTETPCPAGTASSGGASVCSVCGADNQYSTGGQGSCAICPGPTKFTSGGNPNKREACLPCPGGSACDGTNTATACVAGKFSAPGAGVCSDCGHDSKHSSSGASECVHCRIGYTTPHAGTVNSNTQDSCVNCPSGSACDGWGTHTAQCAAGKFSAPAADPSTLDPAAKAVVYDSVAACQVGGVPSSVQSITFGVNDGGEARCITKGQKNCWDSCNEKFPDGTDAHGAVRALYVPPGYVAKSYSVCGSLSSLVASNAWKNLVQVLGSGCHPINFKTGWAGYTIENSHFEFVANPGGATCAACGSGALYSSAGSSTCETCAAGSFANGGDSAETRAQCTPCPSGYACPDGSFETKRQCLAGKFSVNGAKACTDCGADNKYQTSPGADACLTCPTGSFTNGGKTATRTSCSKCPAGSACDGTRVVLPCVAGTYSLGGATTCDNCGSDRMYSSGGAGTCSACSPGSYTSGPSDVTRTACVSCPAGSSCDGSSVKTICDAGTYSAKGSAKCEACGDDSMFSATAGQGTCSKCPPWSFTSGGDTGKRTACQPCPVGSSCLGSSAVTKCSVGTFSPAAGSAGMAVDIPSVFRATGIYHFEFDVAQAEAKRGGKFTAASDLYLVENSRTSERKQARVQTKPFSASKTLGHGYWDDRSSAADANSWMAGDTFFFVDLCLNCGSDKAYADASGSTVCKTCPAGSFTADGSTVARTSCAACPGGSSCDGSNSKRSCSAGKYASGGSAICQVCNSDKLYSASGASACTTCPTGSFTSGGSLLTHTTCAICRHGYTCDGSSTLSACGAGTYSTPSLGACTECGSPTLYADTAGLSECKSCDAGSYTQGRSEKTRTMCTICSAGSKCVGDGKSDACLAGYFAQAGAKLCQKCGKDHLYSAVSASSCVSCGSGFYTNGNDQNTRSSCLKCQSGSACDGTSNVELCSPGKFVNDIGTKCMACGDDKRYSSSAGATVCKVCPAGSSTTGGVDTSTHTGCVSCRAGHACNGGSTLTPCGGDKKYSGPGATDCKTCAAGFSTRLVGSSLSSITTRTTCRDCPAGYTCDGSSTHTACAAGYFSATKSSVCQECGARWLYSDRAAGKCLTCPTGSRTSGGTSVTRTTCTKCATGESCPSGGELSSCPAGTYGSVVEGRCVSCGADSKYSDAGADSCKTCRPGSYSSGGTGDGLTRTTCNLCPLGHYCPDGTSTGKQPCSAGKYATVGRFECVSCGYDNQYQNAPASSCKVCLAGFKTTGGSLTTHTGCEKCAAGSTCDGTSSSSVCPAGKFSGVGATTCFNCGTSKLYSESGKSECSTCTSGSYTSGNTDETRTTCSACPAGYACDGSSKLVLCVPGKYSNKLQTSCVSCGSDKMYSAATAATKCEVCPTGSSTSGGDAKTRTVCTACAAGSSCDGSNTVTPCGADNKFSGPGRGECSTCASGFRSTGGRADKTTRTGCISCSAGHKCDGTSLMVACLAGYFSGPGSGGCSECGANQKYSENSKAASCKTCPVGSFTEGGTTGREEFTRTSCKVCPDGSICGTSSKPSKCAAGTYVLLGKCQPCGSDNKYSDDGASVCQTCRTGYYTRGGGSDGNTRGECVPCPAGSFCPDGSSTKTACSAGTYSVAGQHKCSVCGYDNKYAAGTGTPNTCAECSPGFKTTGGSLTTHTGCEK